MDLSTQTIMVKRFKATVLLLFLCLGGAISPVKSQDTLPESDASVTFSFRKTPWEKVLFWVAEQNDLSFNLWYTPKGTLTLVDEDREYTPKEALDEINGHLLSEGYTLLQRNNTLYILDLGEEVDKKLIRDLLLETPLEKLPERGKFEITKVRFALTSLTAEAGKQQIEQLIGPQGSIITVPLARQLVVTDTGENLRRIKETLDSVEKQLGTGVKAFRLHSATADEVAAVAKPLLGIQGEASSTEDNTVSLSVGTKGKTVYATGTPDKLAIIQQVVDQVEAIAAAEGSANIYFKSHAVRRGNPQTILRVVQTMLSADPRVRLDAGVDNIMAYASAEQHEAIAAAIAEVEIAPVRLDVIPLRRTSPLTAVALVERIFVKEGDAAAPIIDAMFEPDQLVVRGSEAQIEQIRQLLASIGERILEVDGLSRGPDSRMLPIDDATLPEALEVLRRMWPEVGNGNRIRIIEQPNRPLIRVVPRGEDSLPDAGTGTGAGAGEEQPAVDENDTTSNGRPVTQTLLVQQPQSNAKLAEPVAAPEIVLTMTPEGLMVVSEDSVALDALEDLFNDVGLSNRSNFNLFHLKHIKPEEAKTLLTSLFSGDGALGSGSTDSNRGGVLGLMGDSSSGAIAPTMITDNRLNRLWVKGTASQVRDVEEYLKVIDVESGPVEVETNPKPSYIPVFYQNAEDILEILKNLYADRIVQPNQQGRGGPSFGGRSPFGFGRGGDSGGDSTTGETPKMTLAADPTSNLVIVSAPGPLLREVEEVVRELDVRAEAAPTEQYVVHRLTSGASPSVIKQALKGSYGDVVQTEGDGIVVDSGRGGSSRSSSSSSSDPSADRRAAFFQMMRSGGGGFPGRPSFGGGPPSFGGGGGPPGGSPFSIRGGGPSSGGPGGSRGGGGRGR